MKYTKMLNIGLACVLAIGLTACGSPPETAMGEQMSLGSYEGMSVTFIKDKSDTPSKGFYIIDDTSVNKNLQNNKDLEKEKLVGHYNNLNVFYVKDTTNSPGRGFYMFKNSDGQIIPSLNMATQYSSGKSTTINNVGVIYTSSINNPQTLNIKVTENETVDVSKMSSKEVIELAQSLLKVANDKNVKETLDKQPISTINTQMKLR